MLRRRHFVVIGRLLCLLVLAFAGCSNVPKEQDVFATILIGNREIPVTSGQRVSVGEDEFSLGIQLEPGGSAAQVWPFLKVSTYPLEYSDGGSKDGVPLALFRWDGGEPGQVITVQVGKGAPLGDGFTSRTDYLLTVERRRNPRVVSIGLQGYPAPHNMSFIAAGSHSFDIRFDSDMDRASVEKALVASLSLTQPDISPAFVWSDARALNVTATLTPAFIQEDYRFSLTGAVDSDGLPLDSTLFLTVGWPSQVLALQMSLDWVETPLATIGPGQTVSDVSSDGTAVVTTQPVSTWNPEEGEGWIPQHVWLYRHGASARDLSRMLGELIRAEISGDTVWCEAGNGPALLGASFDLNAHRRVEWNTHFLLGHGVSGDGKIVAWFAPDAESFDQQTNVVNLHVYRTDTAELAIFRGIATEPLPYNTEKSEPFSVAVDQAGTRLVYTNWLDDEKADLTLIELSTGTVVSRVPLGVEGRNCELSADGTHAAGVGWAVDLSTGKVTHYREPDSSLPTLSPDGKYMAYAVAQGGSVNDSGPTLIKLVEIDTGRQWELGDGYPVDFSGDGTRLFVVRKAK